MIWKLIKIETTTTQATISTPQKLCPTSKKIIEQLRRARSMGKKRLKSKLNHSTLLPNLPDEIVLFIILTRLTVKSLHKFSCICKLWYKTIHHDQNFMTSHFNHAKANPSLLAIFQYKDYHKRGKGVSYNQHYIFLDDNSSKPSMAEDDRLNTTMVGSCNGLICCFEPSDRYTICNPSLQEVLSLPSFDSPYWSIANGFGFDPVKNEFKVVHACGYLSIIKCFVYTLGTNCWRDITSTCNINAIPLPYYLRDPVLLNGALHWLDGHNNKIVIFDLHHETFQVISTPIQCVQASCVTLFENKAHMLCCRCLLESSGCLSFIHLKARSKDEVEMNPDILSPMFQKMDIEMELYMLKDLKYWGKEESIVLHFSEGRRIIYGLQTEQQQILLHWKTDETHIRFYNAHKRSVKELELQRYKGYSEHYVINHVENLLSLKTMVSPGATEEQFEYMSSRRVGMSRRTPRFIDVTDTVCQKPKPNETMPTS